MNWNSVIATALLTPLVTGVAVYLLQQRWREQMEKRLTQFSKLHEKRAEVIAELYKLLVQVESDMTLAAAIVWPDALKRFVTFSRIADDLQEDGFELREERGTPAESIAAFWNHFERHRIYFPEALAKRIRRFYYSSLLAAWTTHQIGLSQAGTDTPLHLDDLEESDQYPELLIQVITITIPSMKEDIEKEFRKLLGS